MLALLREHRDAAREGTLAGFSAGDGARGGGFRVGELFIESRQRGFDRLDLSLRLALSRGYLLRGVSLGNRAGLLDLRRERLDLRG